MVLQGRREMGAEMQKRFAEFAKLSPRQRELLSLLSEKQKKARLGQTTDKVEVQIAELKSKSAKTRRVQPADLAGLTSWFAYTIIEVLSLAGEPLDAAAIQKRLRGNPPVAEIEKTLWALVQLQFIKPSPGGFFRALAAGEYIETPPDIPSVTVRAIHRAQLARAAETLEEQSVDERELIAKTLTVSAQRIPAVKAKIRALMEELADQFMNDSADDAVVAQFNFQFYQQSRKK
jgi:uncharacterized protein (TIGR02147 family)